MKNIFLPGFWDIPSNFSYTKRVFDEHNIDFEVIDYRDYLSFSLAECRNRLHKKLNYEISNANEKVNLICFSMGASFTYDYLKLHPNCNSKINKVILINPLMEPKEGVIKIGYLRWLDGIHTKKYFNKNFSNRPIQLLLNCKLALMQLKYYKNVKFDNKVIEIPAVFLWGEKDVCCKIKNYSDCKSLFSSSQLIIVPNGYHTWIESKELAKNYLLPSILDS